MAEAINLSCPDCGAHLVERENRQNGSTFLGCSNYPECRHTQGIPEYLKLRREGAAELPGFDL